MNAAEAAALIAAVFWALLVSVGVLVLFRLRGLLSESSKLVADLRERSDTLLQRAHEAIDRANTQLDQTESVTASMDELGAGMTELAGQVTALAGLGRAIAGGPVGRLGPLGALAYGVRHAVGLRRIMDRGELTHSPAAAGGQINRAAK
jgi:hypothetical protein